MSWLVLKAQFIAERYGGEEWPPAPMRLLQAIVAGVRSIDHPALTWLETQKPPTILAEHEPATAAILTWVPNNTAKGTPATPDERSGRERHNRYIRQPVSYIWQLSAEDVELAREVIRLADSVHTLGTGHDMCRVAGQIEDNAPPQSTGDNQLWQPMPALQILRDGARSLRVPMVGSLASIEARFQAGLRRYQGNGEFVSPVLPPALFATQAYAPANEIPRHVMLPIELATPEGAEKAPSWHCGDAVIVAGMLRNACMNATRNTGLADWAAGHAPADDLDARLSWVPLPSIGHQHADRRIRRAILLARPQEAEQLAALYPAVLSGQLTLVDQSSGEIKAIARQLDTADKVLAQYRRAGTVFQSITPVALPGDFATDERRTIKLLRKAILEAGIDPGLVSSIKASHLPLHPRDVPLGAVKTKAWQARAIPLRHVRIEFSEPLTGPLILGRGRHYGLGLLCANPE
ncbi:type I-U CRISPR-associated protein Csb2 [Uliginosibacterium flavum]|uniref:Type I-U CRISPR-associated protein Csb2 n=1 Tax=Uliginosibacterium flavum TaxID=1396831 RepID=A0ABV2TH06_9RHOO